MRVTVDSASPWGQRLWFEGHEFDAMMDEVRFKAGQDVFVEGRGVDVELILERVYKVVPDYIDLPEGVLGKTLFHGDGRFEVQVSRELSDSAETDTVARRRLRTTLAHECAHIIEHGHLHLIDNLTLPLFGEAPKEPPKVLCRQDAIGTFRAPKAGYDGQWWEYQANRGMASLLLPKREVGEHIRTLLAAKGWSTVHDALMAHGSEEIIRDVMRVFDASMQLVVYRLQDLGIFPRDAGQTVLTMESGGE